jgi:hypothetical protein
LITSSFYLREACLKLGGVERGGTESSLQNASVRRFLGNIALPYIEPNVIADADLLNLEIVVKNVLHRLSIAEKDPRTSVELGLNSSAIGWRLGEDTTTQSAKKGQVGLLARTNFIR